MTKAQVAKTQTSSRRREPIARPAEAPPRPERTAGTIKLIELRAGLFLNVDQIVSLRVLPQEEGNTHAILQLSNGDRMNLTRVEFTAISGEEPRAPMRLPQKPVPTENPIEADEALQTR
jgi:hypothetical protein